MEVAYDPNCKFKDKLNLLLHVAAETPLQTHFPPEQLKYRSKLKWNLLWILLPIYVTTSFSCRRYLRNASEDARILSVISSDGRRRYTVKLALIKRPLKNSTTSPALTLTCTNDSA
jgi:hypothetical protein